jgi:hypothetical protein
MPFNVRLFPGLRKGASNEEAGRRTEIQAGRIATLVVSALLAAAVAPAPALGNPDPTTGVQGEPGTAVVVTTPAAEPDGFDWADAAIGAAVAFAVAALGGWTLVAMRRRPEEQQALAS